MKASEGELGRVFILRLEDGDRLPDCLEAFAAKKGVSAGHVILVGGIGSGEVVVGPRRSDESVPDPVTLPVDGAHEVLGVGVLAPDESGRPRLHMHAALGRSGHTLSGDIRNGVAVWLVGEAIIYEIKGVALRRVRHPDIKLTLLEIEPNG